MIFFYFFFLLVSRGVTGVVIIYIHKVYLIEHSKSIILYYTFNVPQFNSIFILICISIYTLFIYIKASPSSMYSYYINENHRMEICRIVIRVTVFFLKWHLNSGFTHHMVKICEHYAKWHFENVHTTYGHPNVYVYMQYDS